MATKLNVDHGDTALGKKIWNAHQSNEYTKVDNYKEGMCFNCFEKNAVSALVADICGDCAGKRGRETILVPIKQKHYGLCYFCGTYKFNLEQINARLCQSCSRRVADIFKNYNRKGGMYGVDPFWKSIKRKHGKDWKALLSDGTRSWRK